MKPSIRKRDGRWVLTRPPFGFARVCEVTEHLSWKAARAALLGTAPAAAGSQTERASEPQRLHHPPRGQRIRMGAAAGRQCACGNRQPCANPACRPPTQPAAPPPPPPPVPRRAIRMSLSLREDT